MVHSLRMEIVCRLRVMRCIMEGDVPYFLQLNMVHLEQEEEYLN